MRAGQVGVAAGRRAATLFAAPKGATRSEVTSYGDIDEARAAAERLTENR